MIRTILLSALIVFIAWLSMDYFSTVLPVVEASKVKEKSIKTKPFKIIPPSKNIIKLDTKKDESITLLELLAQNRFYDALTLYLEDENTTQAQQIETYLAMLAKSDPIRALEYMQVFLDNVPESMVWKLMIETHIAQGNLAKAIKLILQAKENYVSDAEEKRLSRQLKDVSVAHIDALMQRKEYAILITFLEEMINYDGTNNFYAFRLAQIYIELDKTNEASVLLEDLKYDEVYAQNVKTLLSSIDKDKEKNYEYSIPLQKHGDHYIVNVFLDGTAFNLLLDTGATYIFIDEEKASMLEVIRSDLLLQTASNNVQAKLCIASSMKVGNLELNNIQVTTAPFKRDRIDGLLGMNFFKQFTFFINQDENVLYLNPK